MSNTFALTGDYGSGKTLTIVSFLPPKMKYGEPVYRLIVDLELRTKVYQGPKDDPSKFQYAFTIINEGERDPGPMFHTLMIRSKAGKWKDDKKPHMVGIDDLAMLQNAMFLHWGNKENAMATAKIYGLERERQLAAKTWKPTDPGTIALFKRFFEEWILDLRFQGIYLLFNTTFKNVWKDYGAAGYGPDNLPKMRIQGQTAKMLDVWQKHTDAVWVLSRTQDIEDGKKKVVPIPTVTMDLFTPKAALPGVPEQFEWPGWADLWKWHEERKFTADVTKLAPQTPSFDADTLQKAVNQGKSNMVLELAKENITQATIKEIMLDEMAPEYTVETHEDVKTYIRTIVEQRKEALPPPEPEAVVEKEPVEEEPVEEEKPKKK